MLARGRKFQPKDQNNRIIARDRCSICLLAGGTLVRLDGIRWGGAPLLPIEVQYGLRNPSKLFLRLVLASLEHGADSGWVHPPGPQLSGIAKPYFFSRYILFICMLIFASCCYCDGTKNFTL